MKRSGFTLIELVVASSVFIIIVAIASAAFVESIRTQRITIELTAANNSLSQSIEQMAREIRTGRDFSNSEENELRFQNYRGESVSYRLLEDNTIGRCVSSLLFCGPGDTYVPITSDRQRITRLRFIYFGIGEGDNLPPRITIAATVEANPRGALNFQTTVSGINIGT